MLGLFDPSVVLTAGGSHVTSSTKVGVIVLSLGPCCGCSDMTGV